MAFFDRTLTFLDLYGLQYNWDIAAKFQNNSRLADDTGLAAKGSNIALTLAGRGLFDTGIAVGGGGLNGAGPSFPGTLLTASSVGGTLPGAAFYGNPTSNLSLSNQYKATFRFAGAPLTAGLRDVSGNQNNLLDPSLGSTLAVMPRLLQGKYDPVVYVTGTGGFTSGNYTNPSTYNSPKTPTNPTGLDGAKATTAWNGSYTYDYGVRGGTIYDADPRLISNLVADSTNTITKGILRYLADPTKVGQPGVVVVGGTAVTNDPTLAVKRGLGVAVDNPAFEILVIDNPHAVEWTATGTQAGTRLNPVTGAVNPLRHNEWFQSFGQFFDHGLDFETKGQDGKVVMTLMPSDPLYQKAFAFYKTNVPGASDTAAAKYAASALSQVRSDTIWVEIGKGSSDALLAQLGFTESGAFKPGGVASTSSLLSAVGADVRTTKITVGGNIVLNGQIIALTAGQTFSEIALQLNKLSTITGVTVTAGGQFFAMNPAQDGAGAINHDSTMVDLSQIFGNVFSQTVFLKEYNVNGTTTGKLLTHNAVADPSSSSSLAIWSDIKANAKNNLGLTLHDYNVNSVPLVEVDPSLPTTPPGTFRNLRFVALDVVSGAKVYISDTADSKLQGATPSLVLAKAGVAFLDDISPYAGDTSALNVNNPDLVAGPGFPGQAKDYKYWLDHHFVSGDGRANENIGLSAIHEIFVKFHNANVDSIVASFASRLSTDGLRTGQLVAPTGEQLFQEAKIMSEATYQHMVFASYVRSVSPNIAGFVGTDVTIDAGIPQEFANAIFRLGHTGVGDALNSRTNTAGVVNYTNGGDVSLPLLEAFLNPLIYTKDSAAQLSAGSLSGASYNTDEFVEGTLRTNLLGAGLDLAAFNIMRGRDNGLPTLNEARRKFTESLALGLAPGLGGATNPGAAPIFALLPTLRPYTSWQDFIDHLQYKSSGKQFLQAYARNDLLLTFGAATGSPLLANAKVTDYYASANQASDAARLAWWGNLQASTVKADSDLYQAALAFAADKALLDSSFVGVSNFANANANGNQDFEKIDLWMGGLAEAKVVGGMLGPVFDAIFATAMQREQEGDRFYYLARVAAEDWFIDQVDSKTFVDIIANGTGLKHLYADPFVVNDNNIELSALPPTVNTTLITLVGGGTRRADTNPNQIPASSRFAPTAPPPIAGAGISNNDLTNYFNTHPLIDPNNIAAVRTFLGNSAGWVRTGGTTAANAIYTFCGNPGNYNDSQGVLNYNGIGHSSEMIAGTSAVDRINGGDGNETLYGDGGNDILEGGQGNDYSYGGDGNDTMTDGTVNGGDDNMNGGDGLDTMFGDIGNDTMRGGNGADAMHGSSGNDLMYGDSGVVTGAGATAVMDALGGADAMTGGEGNDTMYGGGGTDVLDGGFGVDLLVGGADADAIACGLDNDVDIVWFDTAPVNGIIDSIAQFTVGGIVAGYTANDLVRISRTVFTGGAVALPTLGVLAANAFQYTDAVGIPVASTAAARFLYNQTNGALWYDSDGSGTIAAEQIATFAAYDPLNANDPTAQAPVLQNTNFVIV